MPKRIVYLEDDEIRALAILCKSALRMGDIPFYQKLEVPAKSALDKLQEKVDEIDDGK